MKKRELLHDLFEFFDIHMRSYNKVANKGVDLIRIEECKKIVERSESYFTLLKGHIQGFIIENWVKRLQLKAEDAIDFITLVDEYLANKNTDVVSYVKEHRKMC